MSTKSWADAKVSGQFDEDSHPRDDHGKFSAGGGGGSSATGDIGIRSTSPKEFKADFDKAFKNSEFTNHVTHYSEKELEGMKLFVTKSGDAGVAVHDHGDGRVEATALFNSGNTKGAGLLLLAHTIEHAKVNYVECYGPKLNQLYEKLGFKPDSQSPFNPEYAAPTWDKEKFDSPDYFTMRLK
jgi:hypothetical protein